MERSILKKVIIDQKEEIESLPLRKKIIDRDCYQEYLKLVDSSQIKVITGIRRCGKSILSYQLLKGKSFAYVNFDDEKLYGISAEELNEVLEVFYEVYGNFKYVLLDEIQNIAGWELFVNRLHRNGFNVIVTGSNSNLLSKELSTHLTGRHISLELYPFSFKEFLLYRDVKLKGTELLTTKERSLIKKMLDEYIINGGFPEVVKEPENKSLHLQSLYSNILNKDIIMRYKIKFPKTIKEIANNLISNTSSRISFNKIKNVFGLKSIHTALNYLSYLEESFLFFLVPRFSHKAKERSNANRKIYAIDSGLINSVSVNFSQNIGKVFENLVFLELTRRPQKFDNEIYYWQDVSQNEVDFVLKEKTRIKELIQVCYDLGNFDTKKREINSLMKASKDLKCNNLTIITKDYEATERTKEQTIKFVPLWKWLLEDKV